MTKRKDTGDVRERREPIAIVGVGLRFPGGNDTFDGFGEFLAAGRSGTGPIPEDRWDVAALAGADPDELSAPADKGLVRTAGGGFLHDVSGFDARFFNMSPRRARHVDPQQRLVLECAWEALEHANIDPTTLRGSDAGVYVGVASIDYLIEILQQPDMDLDPAIGTGIAHSAVAGRLSYFLGVHGPSISLDTACSSSLVALHLAVEALRGGECPIALCGGVTLIHQPFFHVILSNAKMLAPDGRCKTFDQAADGYGRSEGCGIAVLKRLSDAERDGDRILGLVRGTAVRQDGASGGLTVPNGTAQAAVMRAALANAGLEPSDIGYVEAHGTGTPLGDPIELAAIDTVLGSGVARAADEALPVASVKTNIGHMEAAAGLGGLVKTLLQLRDGELYPHLNLTQPSSLIPWEKYPLRVPLERTPWPESGQPRRALVNSYGFAGTLATAVVEQAPMVRVPPAAAASSADLPVLTISARTDSALRALAAEYRRHIEARPDLDIAAFCRTTNIGRAAHEMRIAAAVESRAALLHVLERVASGEPGTGSNALRGAQTAFVFAGSDEGAESHTESYEHLGTAAHEAFRVFRRRYDACQRLFAAELGSEREPEAARQAALFMFEYALAELWLDWGVRPDALLGHGLGEVTAAAVAEVLDLPSAVRLVAARARGLRGPELRAALAELSFGEPVFTLISTVTGTVVDPQAVATPDYWVEQLSAPVDFNGGMATLDERGPHVVIEIGARDSVAALATGCVPAERHRWVSGPGPSESAGEVLRRPAAQAFAAGLTLDWRRFHEGRPGRMLSVPGYRFERKRHWIPAPASEPAAPPSLPLPGREVECGSGIREFVTALSGSASSVLAHYRVLGRTTVPAAAYVELILAAQHAVFGTTDRPLRRLSIERPLYLDDRKPAEIRTRLRSLPDGTTEARIISRTGEGAEACHAIAGLAEVRGDEASDALCEELEKAGLTLASSAEYLETDAQAWYTRFSADGLDLGPEFRRVQTVRTRHGAALAMLRGNAVPATGHLPPGILDSAFQVATLGRPGVVVSVENFHLLREPRGDSLRCVSRRTDDASGACDVMLADEHGPVLVARGVVHAGLDDFVSGGDRS